MVISIPCRSFSALICYKTVIFIGAKSCLVEFHVISNGLKSKCNMVEDCNPSARQGYKVSKNHSEKNNKNSIKDALNYLPITLKCNCYGKDYTCNFPQYFALSRS